MNLLLMTPLVVRERWRGAVAGRDAEAMEMDEEDVDGDKWMVGGGSKSR